MAIWSDFFKYGFRKDPVGATSVTGVGSGNTGANKGNGQTMMGWSADRALMLHEELTRGI